MAEKRNYASLDQFSTEALEEMLRADIDAAGNYDDEFVLHILEVIEKRERENSTGRLCDVDKAWEDFQKYYQTPEGAGQALYPTEPLSERERNTALNKRYPIRRILRRLSTSAAMAAVILSIMVVAQAAGFDICGAIAKWTDETLHFESTIIEEEQPTPEGVDYSDIIKEALMTCELSPAIVPNWFPDSFEMNKKPEIVQNDVATYVWCSFQNDKGEIYTIQFEYFYSPDNVNNTIFEKDNTALERYSNGEQIFYIMSNLDTITATWSNGQLGITIYGQISTKEVKQIIDSMGGNYT